MPERWKGLGKRHHLCLWQHLVIAWEMEKCLPSFQSEILPWIVVCGVCPEV